MQVGYNNSKDKLHTLEGLPVIQGFTDVFPEEIFGFPPKRDIDFTIELILGVLLVPKIPYQRSIL